MQQNQFLTKTSYGLFIMKISLTAIIFTASLSGLMAYSSNAQSLKESVVYTDAKTITLSDFFRYVENETPYEFI